jgi:peptidoglycan/LPS O-acetylase OafA/YrhL
MIARGIVRSTGRNTGRNKRLDVLRCVAVLVVIVYHSSIWESFGRVGWAGVDLFFVLSGFLISGLLFSEYKKCHAISFQRFFVRRGFKIYPAFYAFLLIAGVMEYAVLHTHASTAQYLHDIFFIMNYKTGVWVHLWSLGVEEHFYIFLPILLLLLMRFSSDRNDPFRVLPWVTLIVSTLCIVFRALSIDAGTPNFHMVHYATHNRMDALFFGVLLGYFFHFRPEVLEGVMRPTLNRFAIALVSVAFLCLPCFIPLQGKVFATLGYTFIYIGFGGVLLLSLYVNRFLPRGVALAAEKIGAAFAFIGIYSYSIYLWHDVVQAYTPGIVHHFTHISLEGITLFTLSTALCLTVGIVMSRLIEWPMLRLRDKMFPALASAPVNEGK